MSICFKAALILFLLALCNCDTQDDHRQQQRQQLECRLILYGDQYYFVLLGAKLQITGPNTLTDLDIASETAISVSKDLFDSLAQDEPIDSRRIARYTVLFHLVHNCHLQPSVYKPSPKAKVLVYMVDSRTIKQTSIQSAHYFALCAALNLHYSKMHGYDFTLFHLNTTNLEEDVRREYGVSPGLQVAAKDAPDPRKNYKALFNTKRQQFRAAPWAKVAVLAYLIKMIKTGRIPTYDFICFVDSDAVFNPDMFYRSISDFYSYWSIYHRLPMYINSTNTQVIGTSVKNASLIFLSDCPLCRRKKPLPNSGVIFARPLVHDLSSLLSSWWDYKEDAAVIAKSTAYEQDALCVSVLWEYPDLIALANGEHQMFLQNDYKPVITTCVNQWICHLIHWYADSSNNLLIQWVVKTLHLDDTSFNVTVADILSNHTVTISSLSLTQYIENKPLSSFRESELTMVAQKLSSKLT